MPMDNRRETVMWPNGIAGIGRALSAFRQRDDGHVAVTFALTLVPLLLSVGAAVDYSRGNQARTSLAAALDSAVLAAAIDGTSDWQTVATRTFNGNVDLKGSTIGTLTFWL